MYWYLVLCKASHRRFLGTYLAASCNREAHDMTRPVYILSRKRGLCRELLTKLSFFFILFLLGSPTSSPPSLPWLTHWFVDLLVLVSVFQRAFGYLRCWLQGRAGVELRAAHLVAG